jgi:hypothetical protein
VPVIAEEPPLGKVPEIIEHLAPLVTVQVHTKALVALPATAYTIIFEEDMADIDIKVSRGGLGTKYKIYLDGDGGCATAPAPVSIAA